MRISPLLLESLKAFSAPIEAHAGALEAPKICLGPPWRVLKASGAFASI